MVTDFARHGNRLVESYEKGLQDYVDSHKANNDRTRQTLVKVFQKAQADRGMTSKAVVKRNVQNMKARWETQQAVLREKMATALAACAQ